MEKGFISMRLIGIFLMALIKIAMGYREVILPFARERQKNLKSDRNIPMMQPLGKLLLWLGLCATTPIMAERSRRLC